MGKRSYIFIYIHEISYLFFLCILWIELFKVYTADISCQYFNYKSAQYRSKHINLTKIVTYSPYDSTFDLYEKIPIWKTFIWVKTYMTPLYYSPYGENVPHIGIFVSSVATLVHTIPIVTLVWTSLRSGVLCWRKITTKIRIEIKIHRKV